MIRRDHYLLLGVPRTAGPCEIRTAFKARALERHPDRAGTDATDEFRQLSDAYHVLADPARRAAYDSELKRRESQRTGPVTDLRRRPPPRPSAEPFADSAVFASFEAVDSEMIVEWVFGSLTMESARRARWTRLMLGD
jgi:DnaJ-class molecular chaperone